MVRVNIYKLFLLVLLFSIQNVNAQKERDWQVKTTLSFAPGFLTENTKTIQLQGSLGFLRDKIELRGDGFYFINSFGDRPRFNMNHQLFSGAFYHFSDKNFQPYIGFQPGIALSQSSEYLTYDSEKGDFESKISINPVASVSGGFELYAEKWFYLFFESRYIFGKHTSDTHPIYLDEFRVSFGLGFFL